MSDGPNKFRQILYFAGFAILATFFGVGMVWIVVGILVDSVFKSHADKVVAESLPLLVAGGAAGLVVGLLAALWVARADPKTKQRIEKKYVGVGGRMRIYFGAPMFVIIVFGLLFRGPLGRLAQAKGDYMAAYIALGLGLTVFALGLFIYDRIPVKYIIPTGIIGWLLIVLLFLVFSYYMYSQW